MKAKRGSSMFWNETMDEKVRRSIAMVVDDDIEEDDTSEEENNE